MKRFNIFATMALAMVLGLGAAIGIGSGTKEVRSAEADSTSRTIYYSISTTDRGDGNKVKVYYHIGTNSWDEWRLADATLESDTYNGNPVYKATISEDYGGLGELRFQMFRDNDYKWQTTAFNEWKTTGFYNDKLFVHGTSENGDWVTYTKDTKATRTFYFDTTPLTSIGSHTPVLHYWNSIVDTTVNGAKIDSSKSNSWWVFTTLAITEKNLKFQFYYNDWAWQTNDITYDSDYNLYVPNATSRRDPSNSYKSSGTIHTVTKNQVLNSESSPIGTFYALNALPVTIPTIPSVTGYTSPSSWRATSAGTGASYTPNSKVAFTSDASIFAIYVPAVYTITYDRNLNDSTPQVLQNKNHGINVNALTPGSSTGMTGAAWEPSFGKRFTHWNSSYDDKGDVVDSGAAISSNASFWLYYIEDWYDFRYRIDSGSWINLVHNDEGKSDGVKAQFAPATAQSLPLHGKITFQYNNGTDWYDLAGVSFEGNYDSTDGIELATYDTIYLKIYDGNTYGCWVPGISDRTIAVFDSSSATTGGVPYTMRGTSATQTVTTLEVTIEKGQFVRRGYAGNYTYGSIFIAGSGTSKDCFTQVGSETAIECIKTGVYTAYNQAGSLNNWKDVLFDRDEEASAKYLAQKFNTIISDICEDIVAGTKTLAQLQNVWGSKSGTELYKHFNGQITATMNFFKTSSTTEDTDILACVAKYDYVVKKYGTTALPDFLGRANGYSANPQGRAIIALFGQDQKSMSTMIIVTVSSIATIGAFAGYFFYKKKKEDR